MMSQIVAIIKKSLKEFLRDKVVLFFTFALPIFFLFMMPFMWGEAPNEIIAKLKGSLCIGMITLLIMTAGQSDLPGSIAADRERGLYLKIASMPIKPWKEGLGRIFGIWILSLIGSILLLLAGIIYGAKFDGGFIIILECIGCAFLIALTSTGVGLIIASFIKGESAATHAGVAITLLIAFLSGLVIPYLMLPSFLQIFARVFPISSANALIVLFLEGEEIVGYNPLSIAQISLTILLSFFLFIFGIIFYSKFCWRKR